MAVHIGENKFVITTEPKTFYFDLPKVVGIILKYENYFIIKHNEPLAEHTIKRRLDDYCPSITMKTILLTWQKVKPMNHTNLFSTIHRD